MSRRALCSLAAFAALGTACSLEESSPPFPIAHAGSAGAPSGGSGGSAGSAGAMSAGTSASGQGGSSDSAGAAGHAGDGAEPELLSTTGLYVAIDPGGELMLGSGVMPYEPKYKLWSDAAEKSRWVYLPEGSTIDTSDPDHWRFPIGTKFWKEFSIAGQRIETRLIERVDAPEEFSYRTYWWKTQEDAELVPEQDSIRGANGTNHDIPFGQNCHRCHDSLEERVLGFGALQLSHDLPGVTLATLTDAGRLSDPLPANIGFPGDMVAQNALGYLHANCGNCHNDDPGIPLDALPAPQMYLRVKVSDASVEDTGAYRTALNVPVSRPQELGVPRRITGGDSTQSAIWYRMSLRFTEAQMPPLATDETDPLGMGWVAEWIAALPPPEDP